MDRQTEEGGLAKGQLDAFGARLTVAVRSLLAADIRNSDLEVHLLVNPIAGKIANAALREQFICQLEAAARRILGSNLGAATSGLDGGPARGHGIGLEVFFAESPAPGGLGLLVREALRGSDTPGLSGTSDDGPRNSRRKFFIAFGGDGTHQETLDALISNHQSSDNILFTRVGLGTGNDGVDLQTADDLAQVLSSLDSIGPMPLTAVRVSTARGVSSHAGNIAGVGMDAYVVFLSEDYKKRLPGQAYKIAADLGVLFYKRTFKLKEATVTVERGGERKSFALLPGILSFGASGFRCYGQGLPVLPGPENFCIIPVGTLFQNIALKGQLYHGTHVESPRVRMEDVDLAIIDYPGRLPMQLDGEVQWLEAEDFPVRFERITVGSWLIKNRSIDAVPQYLQSQQQGLELSALHNYRDNA